MSIHRDKTIKKLEKVINHIKSAGFGRTGGGEEAAIEAIENAINVIKEQERVLIQDRQRRN